MLLTLTVSVEENLGREFGVFIELTEVGFVIAFVIIFHVFFKQSGWWQKQNWKYPH